MTREDPILVSSTHKVPQYLVSNRPQEQSQKLPYFAQLHIPSIDSITPKQLSLPGCWTTVTKSQNVELGPGNLTCTYQGPGKSEQDSVAVRGNVPISRACGIYYYEVAILSKGRDGYIGVGFTTLKTPSNRLPGQDDGSWGYHAADGKKFGGNSGISYGPPFSTGDVIGCCINFADMSISFTRNGILLGNAFKGILKGEDEVGLYPCVGLRTPGEHIKANFGKEPFKFDIAQFYSDEKYRLWRQIQQTPIGITTPRPIPHCSIMNRLVVEWLVRSGYAETAKTLYTCSLGQAHQLDQTNESFESILGSLSIESRKHAIHLVKHGPVKHVIAFVQDTWPKLLDQNPIIHCQLLCLEFLELLQQSSNSMDVDGQSNLSDAIVYLQHIKNMFSNTPGSLRDAVEV